MNPRVLVIDDSPTIRRVVSTILEKHGISPVLAEDGQAAIDKLVSGEVIDLALVDFVMPRMNGFQFCRTIRAHETFRDLPVVLMSAKADRIREQFIRQTGALDAISKPFDARALVAVVENALRKLDAGHPSSSSIDLTDDIDEWIEPHTSPTVEITPVVLSGDMAAVPIGAIMQLLQVELKTGLLRMKGDDSEIHVTFREGLIDLVRSRGTADEFRIGRFFVERGLVTPQEIDAITKSESDDDSARSLLGNVLMERGKILPSDLREALASQSSELIYEALRWKNGVFEFSRESPSVLAKQASLGLPVASAVMEGFRRVDEWRLLESTLEGFNVVPVRDLMQLETLDVTKLPRPEQNVLEAVDGKRTVAQIIQACHMSSFDTCRILVQFMEARILRKRAKLS